MSWFWKKKPQAERSANAEVFDQTSYMMGFNSGYQAAFGFVAEMQQTSFNIMAKKAIKDAEDAQRVRFEKVLENHKKRVSKAAAPEVVAMHDALVRMEQDYRVSGNAKGSEKCLMQLEVIKQLMEVR